MRWRTPAFGSAFTPDPASANTVERFFDHGAKEKEHSHGSMILRCTKKLLDLLDANPLGLTEPEPSEDDWYANLLWVDRQKCLLFTHAGTLFSVFVAGVRKADLRPIGPYVVSFIEQELRSEGLPINILGRLDPDLVVIAKTASRSTLRFMKEIALHAGFQIEDAGGLHDCDISALNYRLRHSLHNYGGTYAYPIERVLERQHAMSPSASIPQGKPRSY
jgi:hypothetical protein